MQPIILGSQSPRRKEILSYFSIPFTQIPSHFDEDSIPFNGNPHEYVTAIAEAKAKHLQPENPNTPILTADTIVYKEGRVYGKPKDKAEAIRFLEEFSGSWHSVFSAVAIRVNNSIISDAEETKVLFNKLEKQQIENFQNIVDSSDKAGGYTLQGPACLLCQKIEGCYYNVMGLPMNTVYKLLKKGNIDLWDHTYSLSS
jgi:septum formation protein